MAPAFAALVKVVRVEVTRESLLVNQVKEKSFQWTVQFASLFLSLCDLENVRL